MTKYRTLDDVMAGISKERREKIEAKTNQTIASIHLSAMRKERGISQQQLAKKLNISQSAISQLENQGDFQLDTLVRYVNAVGGNLVMQVNFDDGTSMPLLPQNSHLTG